MSRHASCGYVDGATEEERKKLLRYRNRDVFKPLEISKYLYSNFLKGKRVPPFVRERLICFLLKEEEELKKSRKRRKN